MFKLKTNKTFEDIISGFNSMLEELEDLVRRNDSRIEDNNVQVQQLVAESRALTEESNKARVTADRIKALIGG